MSRKYNIKRKNKEIVGTGGLLRFGHARGLTPHRGVIQDPRAASLPRLSEKAWDCSAENKEITPTDFSMSVGVRFVLLGKLGFVNQSSTASMLPFQRGSSGVKGQSPLQCFAGGSLLRVIKAFE